MSSLVPNNLTDPDSTHPICSMSLSQCGYVIIILAAAVLVSGATVLVTSLTRVSNGFDKFVWSYC